MSANIQAAAIAKPNRYLCHSSKHFTGYIVQLNTAIRRHPDASDILSGIFDNPLKDLLFRASEAGGGDTACARAVDTLRTLYAQHATISTSFPPSASRFDDDPVGTIVDMLKATSNGWYQPPDTDTPGLHTWLESPVGLALCNKYRAGMKHIWETIVGTLSSQQTSTVVGSLPYGSGLKLLARIKGQQEHQTTMSLYTLFEQLITVSLAQEPSLNLTAAPLMACMALFRSTPLPL